jgi:TonB-linked SusC/RagA family outer membrane protein
MNRIQKYNKNAIGYLLLSKKQAKPTKAFFSPTIPIQALTFLFSIIFAFVSNAQSEEFNLLGKVIDEKTQFPLGGATVQLKGAYHEVIADNDGNFIIKAPTKFPLIIVVTYVGYDSKELNVTNAQKLTIGLTENKTRLNEVVVVGYGTQRKSDITGSIASVNKSLLAQPSTSFDNLLQGAVPGVAVTQSSGQPGSTATIRVRGGNSISFGNDPLYVIDGFIVYNNNSYVNTGASNGVGVNALSTINPSDIESIEILKDASATAIYGSRGANGVVIITTRRGKKSGTEINYDVYVGKQKVRKKLDLLNGAQWEALVNDINESDGKPHTFSDSAIAAIGAGSDWQSAALKDATAQNHELSFSGGDEKSRFLISGNYYSQDGIVVNTGFKRYSGRVNYERNLSEKLKLAVKYFW